jgi:formate--tetrahydrofolate ligase
VGILSDAVLSYGNNKAKIDPAYIETLEDKPDGKLILVTTITPIPVGEGKTTASAGLNDGLNRIGKKAATCLREPSRGPCFGMKGGAAGERSVDSGTI